MLTVHTKKKTTKETAYTQITDVFIPAPSHEKNNIFMIPESMGADFSDYQMSSHQSVR